MKALTVNGVVCKVFLPVFLFFVLSNQPLWSDSSYNGSCNNPERISELDGVSGNVNHTETGNVSSTDTNDYYYFKPGIAGTLHYSYTSTDISDFYISTSGCYNLIKVLNDGISKTGSINITANTTVYLRVKRANGSPGYSITLDFVASTGVSGFDDGELRNFSKLYQTNLYGNIKMIGNTILGKVSGTGTACLGPEENNGAVSARYFNKDPAAGVTSSSTAELNISEASTVVKAYLLWQGVLTVNRKEEAGSVMFKTPTSGGYVDIETDPDKLNWTKITPSGGPYYPYQGMAEVTPYVVKGGTYSVANLATTEGTINTYGSFGAWALVVIYRNESESFKNITLFDGYKVVTGKLPGTSAQEENAELSGFLTPTNGDIKSNFLVFAGEGDRYYGEDGGGGGTDSVSLDGTALKNSAKLAGNAFDATITENGVAFTDKNPNCINNMGIDITTYDVGATGQDLISNGQSGASIKISSDKEAFYPGFFAFSTDLYIPDVCYEENITKNGVVPETIYQGDPLDVNVTIRNMSYEPAKGVSISRFFDSNAEYDPESTTLAAIAKTDANDTDTVEYDSDNEMLRLNIGAGATSTTGGDLAYLDEVPFTYRLIPNSSGGLVSEYKVSYRDESTGTTVQYDQVAIGKCSDRSQTSTEFSVKPMGNVRVVAHGGGWNDGNIKTQLAEGVMQFDLLYATDETGTTLRPNTTIDTVELVNYVSGTVVTSWSNLKTDTEGRVELDGFTLNAAYRKLYFRITDGGAVIATSNSFAVRPSAITIDVTSPGTPLVAGDTHTGVVAFSSIAGYNQVSSVLTFSTEDDQFGTGVGTFTVDPFSFNAAEDVAAGINYSDVGVIKPTVTDSDWASVDRANGLCVAESCSNNPENGLIGCDICGRADTAISFIPDKFTVAFLATPRLDNNTTFTYFSDDLNMSARLSNLELTVVAVNSQGDTTVKYTDRTLGGYEKNINLSLEANASDLRESRSKNAVDADFINGVATVNIDAWPLNYGKNSRLSQNPVTIAGGDTNVSISVNDPDGVHGNVFQQGVMGSATFFYGRLHPIDQSCVVGVPCVVPLYYEVYCNGCDKAAFGIDTWVESVNDVFWYVNPQHDGNQLVTSTTPVSTSDPYNTPGMQTLTFTGLGTGRQRVTIRHTDSQQAPSYLYFHPYSDQNISSFYLDVSAAIPAGGGPADVINNEGAQDKSSSRIGE